MDDPDASLGNVVLVILTALALLGVSFVSSFFRYGLDSFSRAMLLRDLPEDNTRSRYSRYLKSLERTKAGTSLLRTVADVMVVLIVFQLISDLSGQNAFSGGVTLIASVIASALLLLTVSRVLPAALAQRTSEQSLRTALPILHQLGLVLFPLTFPIIALKRKLHATVENSGNGTFADEIIATVAEGEREGVVGEDEADMIENVVELRDFEVSEIMTPRTELDWIDSTASVSEALTVAADTRHSRLPVGEKDSDHIIGMFYIRDVIDRLVDIDRLKNMSVTEICRKPFYVPETKRASDMLKELRDNKLQVAIVLDEYGGTAGLITIEDILEEIVGEIEDEYDKDDEHPVLQKIAPNRAQIDARIHVDDVNEALEISLPDSDDFDTLGGFVFSALGRVPHRGETLTWKNVDIQVLDADERRVKLLELTVNSPEPSNSQPD